MNRIFLVALFATIVPLLLISAEPSAFGAGNLNNSKPYGLTSSEKVILQNKNNLKKVVVKSKNQDNEVDSLRDRIDGLQTIIEGLSRRSQQNRLNLKSLDKKNTQELVNANEYEKRLSKISQLNSKNIRDIKKDIDEIRLKIKETNKLVLELALLLDSINVNFVSKDEFNTLVGDFNNFKRLVAKELKRNTTPPKSKLDKMSSAEIAKQAKKYYDKEYYTNAIEYYSRLIEKNYKPARAHYMIGEMKYYRKNYSDAIAYFKKSASLYSKASYMPTLMLHTAVSMQQTGDTRNAKSFYRAIISKYPNSNHADIANSKLSKMR